MTQRRVFRPSVTTKAGGSAQIRNRCCPELKKQIHFFKESFAPRSKSEEQKKMTSCAFSGKWKGIQGQEAEFSVLLARLRSACFVLRQRAASSCGHTALVSGQPCCWWDSPAPRKGDSGSEQTHHWRPAVHSGAESPEHSASSTQCKTPSLPSAEFKTVQNM